MTTDNPETPETAQRAGFLPGRVSLTLILVRLVVCSFALFAAVLAGCLLGAFTLFRGLESEQVYTYAFAITAVVGVFFVFSQVLLPCAIGIIVTEAFSVRNAFVHVFLGSGIAVLLAWQHLALNDLAPSGLSLALQDRRILLALSSGIVAGFTYWLLAGRAAGSFREPRYRVEADS